VFTLVSAAVVVVVVLFFVVVTAVAVAIVVVVVVVINIVLVIVDVAFCAARVLVAAVHGHVIVNVRGVEYRMLRRGSKRVASVVNDDDVAILDKRL
jgi:hypothetical protein